MNRRLPSILVTLVLLLGLAPALWAEGEIWRLRVGQLTPDGSSVYWKQRDEVFSGSASDLEDLFYGADVDLPIAAGVLGIRLSGSFFEGDSRFTTREDADVTGEQKTNLRLLSATAMVTVALPPPHRVRPWVGVGVGGFHWSITEKGDLFDADGELTSGRATDDDISFGIVLGAGVDFWIREDWGLSLDYRQHIVEGDPQDELKERGKIDLSNREIAVGFVWTF